MCLNGGVTNWPPSFVDGGLISDLLTVSAHIDKLTPGFVVVFARYDSSSASVSIRFELIS